MSTARKVRISFRQKSSSRANAVKVYTVQRLSNASQPRQLHLCYLPASDGITRHFKDKVEESLRRQWREHFGHENVVVDWDNAETKWCDRAIRKKVKVDRYDACEQICTWLSEDEEYVLPHFGGLCMMEKISMQKENFQRAYLGLYLLIAKQLNDEGSAVAVWWETVEAPRLLYAFDRFVLKDPKNRNFTRYEFIEYLRGNINMRFAARQYLRATKKLISIDDIPELELLD